MLEMRRAVALDQSLIAALHFQNVKLPAIKANEAKMKEGPKVSLLARDTLKAKAMPERVVEEDGNGGGCREWT